MSDSTFKSDGVFLHIALHFSREERLVRMSSRGPDGEDGGNWVLQRLAPRPHEVAKTEWTDAGDIQRAGQLPPGVKVPTKHFATALRMAADELERAEAAGRPS